jgi:hypothetical protein
MKQLTQGSCVSRIIQHQSLTTSTGFKYECVEYELLDPFDSKKIIELKKQNIFFENNHGYIIQTTGPPNEFDSDFMNEIQEHIKFKTPIKIKLPTRKYRKDKYGFEFQIPTNFILDQYLLDQRNQIIFYLKNSDRKEEAG